MSPSLRHGSQAIDILFLMMKLWGWPIGWRSFISALPYTLEGENLFLFFVLFSFSTCACVITYWPYMDERETTISLSAVLRTALFIRLRLLALGNGGGRSDSQQPSTIPLNPLPRWLLLLFLFSFYSPQIKRGILKTRGKRRETTKFIIIIKRLIFFRFFFWMKSSLTRFSQKMKFWKFFLFFFVSIFDRWKTIGQQFLFFPGDNGWKLVSDGVVAYWLMDSHLYTRPATTVKRRGGSPLLMRCVGKRESLN